MQLRNRIQCVLGVAFWLLGVQPSFAAEWQLAIPGAVVESVESAQGVVIVRLSELVTPADVKGLGNGSLHLSIVKKERGCWLVLKPNKDAFSISIGSDKIWLKTWRRSSVASQSAGTWYWES